MYAVIRETRFPTDPPPEQRPEFQEIHARQPGQRGGVEAGIVDMPSPSLPAADSRPEDGY